MPAPARIRSVSLSIPEKDHFDLWPITSLLHNDNGTICAYPFCQTNTENLSTNDLKKQEPSIASSMKSAHEECLYKVLFLFDGGMNMYFNQSKLNLIKVC